MSGPWFAVAVAFLSVTGCTLLTPFHDDSHYVPLGPRTGYYIVRPGSALSHQLGLEAAPTIDTADPFRHGYGADALAFRFDHAGILSAPPAYIVQGIPNEFYTRRLGSLIRGQSSEHDVRAFLADPRALRAAQTDSSLTTRSKFTIHFRIDLAPGDANTTGSIRWCEAFRKRLRPVNRGLRNGVARAL